MTVKSAKSDSMASIVEEMGASIIPFRRGDIIEVTVVGVSKQRIMVNIQDIALGFIPFKEFSLEQNNLEPGEKVLAYVLVTENPDGYAVLSMKRADRERLWRTIGEQSASGAVIPVKISDANKGGLVINYGGVEGFLPVSQLASQHYPRVDASERADIAFKLKGLIGQTLNVKILTFDERARKLIFSEKAVGSPEVDARLKELKTGQELEGTITGIVDFGLFVDIGGIEGLVHISEVSWDRIDDLRKNFTVGEKVKVSVIGLEENRVSLSIKRLLADPWQEAAKKYHAGDRAEGAVTRITPYGAFVKLDQTIEGLVHVSEIIDREQEPALTIDEVLKVGESYSFIVLTIDPAAHRVSLSYRSAKK